MPGSRWWFVGRHGPPPPVSCRVDSGLSSPWFSNVDVLWILRVLTFVSSPRLTCSVTVAGYFFCDFESLLVRFSLVATLAFRLRGVVLPLGIVSALLADLLRTFGHSSTSFLSKSSHYFLAFGECFLWVRILLLRRRSRSFFLVFQAFVQRSCFSSGICGVFLPLCLSPSGSSSGVSVAREWVALLGVPFGEGLSLNCGSSSSSFSGFILPSSCPSRSLVSG